MAFTAKDGSKHTNHDSMRRADASFMAKQPAKQASPADDQDAAMEGAEDDPAQVAQEHGPAVEINIQHHHEAGQHHVHSVHPDGHEHHSEHGSAQEAHAHAAQLASEPAEPEEMEGY
jgi:hypothetical protein